MEHIGSCDTKYLNSADMDCQVTLSASQSVEEGTEKEKSQSKTNTQSNTNTQTNEKGTTNEISIAYEFKGGFPGIINAGWDLGYKHTVNSIFMMLME
jgi:hypothetical protein